MMLPDAIEASVAQIRELTDRPFAVNFLVAPFEDDVGDPASVAAFADGFRDALGLDHQPPPAAPPPWMLPAQLSVLEKLDVPVWSFALGLHTELIERGHAAGAKVIGTATTVAEAEALVAAGVDAVVAQGAEAGGHRSTFDVGADRQAALVGTLALVPAVVDAVDVPVVAAGGIMDARGVVAALALGASAVQLGTRFLLATESGAPQHYRDRIIAATEDETVVTNVLTGRATRSIRNTLIDRWETDGPEPLGWMKQAAALMDIYADSIRRGDPEHFLLQAGQGLRLAKGVMSAGDIVEELVTGSRAVIENLKQ